MVKVKGLRQKLLEIASYHTINGLVMIIDAAVKARDMLDKKINVVNIIDQFLLKIEEVKNMPIINSIEDIWANICEECKKSVPVVEKGIFGAHMHISLVNDGPFTIILDSKEIL